MPLSFTQMQFVETLQEFSFRESCLFEIGCDEAIQVIANRSLYTHRNFDQIVTNVLGWLKYYDREHPEAHKKISSVIFKTFGMMQQYAFEEGYIGVDRLLPINFLFRAVESGNVEDIRFVLSHEEFDPNDRRNKDGMTPLTLACLLGSIDAVKALLADPRVDPNRCDDMQYFPLYYGANDGETDVVRELLKHPDIDPNQQHGPAYAAVILAIFYGYAEILKLLSQHPKTNLHFVRSRRNVTPMHDIVRYGNSALKTMGERDYSINPQKIDSASIRWTTFSVLPVSSDKSHKPPTDYFDGLTVVDSKSFRNDRYGELEIHHKKKWTRIVYRTNEYVTVSLLYQNHPLGPTIYKPLCHEALEIRESSNIWHIANKAIANNPQAIHEILSDLSAKRLIVFRSINLDNDVPRIVSNQRLHGRGTSTNVAVQVRGDDTALISASTQPISDFLKGHKKRKNGGYVAIFTKKGARLFLDFQGSYPRFLTHSEVLEEVSHDRTLTKRATRAKECIFYPGIPLELVTLLDGGYPTVSGKKQKKGKNTQPLPRNVQKFLNKQNISSEDLPEDLLALLHSNKKISLKKRAIERFIKES